MKFYILCEKNTPVFDYAKSELERCLFEMDNDTVFDKNGKTIDIVLRENSFANNIIEEFIGHNL